MGKRRRNDRGEIERLSETDTNRGKTGEIYRSGEVSTAGVSEKAEVLDSGRQMGELRRGNRGADISNASLGSDSEAQKRLNEITKPEKRFSQSSSTDTVSEMRREEEKGIPYDNKHQNEQESLGKAGEGRRNLAGEAGRLPRQSTQRGEKREVYRTGKVQVADSAKKTGQVGSLSDSTVFRRGRTDSGTGRNGVREAQKRLNEVSKPEKRFSLTSTVEQTKDLIAVHNMTTSELEKTLDLGGFPMPSIAGINSVLKRAVERIYQKGSCQRLSCENKKKKHSAQ